MEEYLQNMKNLRSQMNDLESQAANASFEEEKLKTEIQTIEKDIESAKNETETLKGETEEMLKSKDHIRGEIVYKQKKIVMLEIESSTLSKTLELLQHEKVSSSDKIKEKRAYYAEVMENMSSTLQEQQVWFNSHKHNKEAEKGNVGHTGKNSSEIQLIEENFDKPEYETNEKYKDLVAHLEYAKVELEETTAKKSKLALENKMMKQNIEQLRSKLDDFPTELKAMDLKVLEEEHKALLSDRDGEMEYLQSLWERIEQIKAIAEVVKCRCGQEYMVEMNH